MPVLLLSLMLPAFAQDPADDEAPAPARSGPSSEAPTIEVDGLSDFSGPPQGFGFGVILGAPTGLSLAWRSDSRSTLAAGLAWNFTQRKAHVHADYLFTLYDIRVPEAPSVGFPIYVGLGGRARVGGAEGFDLGLRVPIGINVLPDEVPIDGFVEIVPVIGLYPETDLSVEGGIGVRIYLL